MRWPTVNCVLLACIATAVATNTTDRPKRDLQFWKDLITAKLGIGEAKPVQKDETVQIVHIPGFENVVVKAVPKVTVVEAPAPIQQHVIQMDPTMAVLQSYLGTQTPDQTLLALQKVKDILQSGILKAREEVVQVMSPQPQILMLPSMAQDARPVYPIYQRPMIPMAPQVVAPPPELRPFPVFQPLSVLPPPPELRPLPVFEPVSVFPPAPALRPLPFLPPAPELRPRPPAIRPPRPPLAIPVLPPRPPLPIPVKPPCPIVPDILVPQLRPLPLPIKPLVPVPMPPILPLPTIPTSYSYKQVKGDGEVTSYSAKDNHAVVIQETNLPPPPLPSYIMDRFQKIIYGLPLGVSTISHISPMPLPAIPFLRPKPQVRVPVPLYPAPIPIISRPSNVEVKISQPNKKLYQGGINVYEGIKVTKHPFNSAIVHEEESPLVVDLPVIMPPSPVDIETSKLEGEDNPLYKRVHGDGSISTFTSTSTGKEDSTVVITEEISKMPSHPSYIADRIKEAAEKGHKPKSMWGYSFKLANGMGLFENGNKDKIYYSHLESGAPKPGMQVFPDPLSSQDDHQEKIPNKNVYYLERDEKGNKNDKTEKDEFGNPFLSKKIKGEDVTTSTTSGQSKIEAVKKFPPLPTPILGENEKISRLETDRTDSAVKFEGKPDTSKESVVIPPLSGIDLTKKSENGSGGFSYTQINKEGSVSTFTGDSKVIVQETVSPVQKISRLPSAVVDVIQPLPKAPSGVVVEVTGKRPPGVVMFADPERPRYVYKQISHTNPKPIAVVELEDRPMIAVPKGEVHVKVNTHHHFRPDGTRYSCNEVHKDQGVKVIETVSPIKKIPVAPYAIVDVIQPLPKAPQGVVVKVSEKRPPGVVTFAEPANSRYVYTQISHTNPKPFTIVEVQDHPIAVPKGEVQVKVNRHYHNRPDGTRYPCSEVHIDPAIPAAIPPAIGIPIAPIPPLPSAEVITTLPSTYVYIPPENASAPSPISHEDSGSKIVPGGFSYTQINKEGSVITLTGDEEIKVQETVSPIKKVPVLPSAIVDVINPVPKAPPSVVVKVSEKRPSGVVAFAEPVPSRHVYKQITHTKLKPLTVVEVEDRPMIEVPKGKVQVKVNRHYHTRPDGTRYPCSEVHLSPGIPASVPSAIGMVEVKPHFSYTQVSYESDSKIDATTKASPEPTTEEVLTTTKEPESFFSRNPIVVAEPNYSYTNTHSDGSSVNVQGNTDNTVSINVEQVKSSAGRGDIPDALA